MFVEPDLVPNCLQKLTALVGKEFMFLTVLCQLFDSTSTINSCFLRCGILLHYDVDSKMIFF